MEKIYDKAYFERWYRPNSKTESADLQRKVQLAVAMAEYHLQRPLQTVLDIGCGQARWRDVLLKLRPKLHYQGFDSSTYVVQRYGKTRNIGYARFADFAHLRPCPPVDLLICADVMHYLSTRELQQGLPALPVLCAGVAYLETYCAEDTPEGDLQGYIARPEQFYRRRLQALGMQQAGAHCWLSPALAAQASALEVPPYRRLRR